jgi:phage protein D
VEEATRKKVEEGGDGAVYEIPEVFQSEAEAQAAVEGQRSNQVREEEKLSLTVVGKETRQAEAKMQVSGIDRDADGEWSIDSITHVFTGTASYTNAIETVGKEKS